jgi:hypothetical protein
MDNAEMAFLILLSLAWSLGFHLHLIHQIAHHGHCSYPENT